jgi:hypothetical protein
VKDRLDVVAVRVQRVGGVVAGVVVALAGTAVVRAAGRERCLVEAGDRVAVGRLEGEVEAGRRLAVGAYVELVYSESALALPRRLPA